MSKEKQTAYHESLFLTFSFIANKIIIIIIQKISF